MPMSKSLQIKIYSEGNQGRIDIIGQISEWGRNNATDFRTKCQELKDAGISNCHVYLMTVGGDCFQANEIVNILTDVFGSYTGEGGAIVASAGTYIGVNAKSFTMAKNGQFMIHKPSGWIDGNETDVENYLTLLKNMTATYYDAYKAVLKKPEPEFKAKWDGGDFWLTAQEAKDWGFITDIKDPVKIDPETAQAIKQSGSPIAIAQSDISDQPNNLTMDLKTTAIALGMEPNSTEEQVNAQIAENAQKAKDYDTLKAEKDRKDAAEKAAKIKTELDAAEKDKRIKADARPKWQEAFEKDFEGTKALLAGLSPVSNPLSGEIKIPVDGNSATYQGKTFEQLQDEDPEALEDLETNNPEAFNALFADWKKRNRIK